LRGDLCLANGGVSVRFGRVNAARYATPGWYPDPTRRYEYRWWADKWTDHVGDGGRADRDPLRPARRRTVGLVLTWQLALLPFAGFLLIGGDPYPVSRVGTTSHGGEVQIVFAVCPGERLRRVEVFRLAPHGDAAGTLRWAVAGDAPVRPAVAIGADVPGLDTEVFLREPLPSTDPLALKVTTNELDHTVLELTPGDLPSTGVFSFGERHDSVEDFRTDALKQTPCDDPYHKEVPGRVLDWLFVIQATAALIGAGLLASLPRYPPPIRAW
jgi:hypothetical protein